MKTVYETNRTKRCSTCKKKKALVAFSKRKESSDGIHYTCKKCDNKRMAAWAATKPPGYHRQRNLLHTYGLTLEAHDSLLAEQKGRCAICDRRLKKYGVDHNHKTNKVRGLLCYGCNTALGLFQDSVKTLRRAISYLTADRI